MEVKFSFSLGQKVRIKANEIAGTVRALFVDRDEKHWFSVEYTTTTGAVCEQYFRSEDVRATD